VKKAAMTLMAFLVAVGLGCNPATPGGGRTHGTTGQTTTTEHKPSFQNPLGPKEGKFTLNAPDSMVGLSLKATTIKQGEQLKKEIGISRGKGVDADVQISFEGLPEGVRVKPANPVLKHGEDKVEITLMADEKAALTKSKVKIVGKPTKGDEIANTEWTIDVVKK
jgi:hypothetical protein